MDDRDRHDNLGLLIGGVLVVVGVWVLLRMWIRVTPIWALWLRVRPFGWPLALIIVGIVVILLTSRGARPQMPPKGTRLYRSRQDKWVSGVFGGLGRYFGIDPVPLRLAFIAAAVLFGGWQAVIAYVIAAWVMPEEPEAGATPAQNVSSPV